jgi:hypothetical protein
MWLYDTLKIWVLPVVAAVKRQAAAEANNQNNPENSLPPVHLPSPRTKDRHVCQGYDGATDYIAGTCIVALKGNDQYCRTPTAVNWAHSLFVLYQCLVPLLGCSFVGSVVFSCQYLFRSLMHVWFVMCNKLINYNTTCGGQL